MIKFTIDNKQLSLLSESGHVISHSRRASIFSTLFCLILSSLANAQMKILADSSRAKARTKKPVFIIDSVITYGGKELIFNPAKIESISMIKADSAKLIYGELGEYGAIIVKTNRKVTFLKIGAILVKFDIKRQDRILRICIDKSIIEDPSNIVADEEEILKVEITTDRNWRYYQDGKSKEKFINIITRQGLRDGL